MDKEQLDRKGKPIRFPTMLNDIKRKPPQVINPYFCVKSYKYFDRTYTIHHPEEY